ncbi:hypothetical protein FIBSPDRAFT_404401 [Athelia psychrophila]|uniref:Uncharacterized protein n=1 Tax=Athelia psychrophila TaxID=1759441 RepID=A0A167UYJ5_9AGAM|nr:hypothetical protein FIBSPDRAFT_1054675 [Fibularhizoctonia sp. CBS 109695]KZP04443.1 hypothetical protein FIBSPDRAFT_404401 [Fibularhizoctonia sp. CBS 109695]
MAPSSFLGVKSPSNDAQVRTPRNAGVWLLDDSKHIVGDYPASKFLFSIQDSQPSLALAEDARRHWRIAHSRFHGLPPYNWTCSDVSKTAIGPLVLHSSSHSYRSLDIA